MPGPNILQARNATSLGLVLVRYSKPLDEDPRIAGFWNYVLGAFDAGDTFDDALHVRPFARVVGDVDRGFYKLQAVSIPVEAFALDVPHLLVCLIDAESRVIDVEQAFDAESSRRLAGL